MGLAIALAIPPNTNADAPASVALPFVDMFVESVGITFPSGCAGLVGVWVDYLSGQLWPYNSGSYFVGDDHTITIHPRIWLSEEPMILQPHGYNLDTLYTHTIYFVFDVQFRDGSIEALLSQPGGLLALFAQPGRGA
jgi:hypothetical protein